MGFFDDLKLSDFLEGATNVITHPLTLGTLGALGGASERFPTKYGTRARGFAGGVEGGLSGLQAGLKFRESAEEREAKQRARKFFSVEDQQVPSTSAERLARLEEIQKEPGYMGSGKVMPSAQIEEKLDPGFTERLRAKLIATPGSALAPRMFEALPDPALYKGQAAKNTETGEISVSDGKKWTLTSMEDLQRQAGSLPAVQSPSDPRAQRLETVRKELAPFAQVDLPGALEVYKHALTKEPRVIQGGAYPTYSVDPFSGEREEVAPGSVSATTQAEIEARKEVAGTEERRRQLAEQIANDPSVKREAKRARIAALGLDPGKFLEVSSRVKIETFTDEKGAQSMIAVDEETGKEVWRKSLGRHPSTIERTTKTFRDKLALRSQGKKTGDSDVDGLTAEQATKALGDLRGGGETTTKRGSTVEAYRAMVGVAELPGFDKASTAGKRQMLEETAARFGLSIVGDVPVKRDKLGFGSYDLSGLALAPMQSGAAPAGASPVQRPDPLGLR